MTFAVVERLALARVRAIGGVGQYFEGGGRYVQRPLPLKAVKA